MARNDSSKKLEKLFQKGGWAVFPEEKYDQAIALLTQALKLETGRPEVYYERGRAYAGKGDYARAIVDYTRAIKSLIWIHLDPADYYQARGDAYAARKESAQARADYERAIKELSHEISRSRPRLYYYRGDLYLKLKDYDRAIADYTQALKEIPKTQLGMLLFRRSEAYLAKKNYDRAIRDCSRGMKADQRLVNCFLDLRGRIYAAKGVRDKGASPTSRKAVRAKKREKT